MKRTLAMAVAAISLAAALPIVASADKGQGGDARPKMERGMHKAHFGPFDADKDGVVTKAEAKSFGEDRFGKIDADGDGKVTAAEMEADMMARLKERVAERMKRADTDGDGVISADEAAAMQQRMFARMDRNDDGVLSSADRRDRMKRHHMHHRRHGEGMHDGMRHGMRGGPDAPANAPDDATKQ